MCYYIGMIDNMILSASGWRKVFASSNDENDTTNEIGEDNTALAVMIAEVFADYVKNVTKQEVPVIVCGTDTRPTGHSIVDAILKTLNSKNIVIRYTGIATIPEIMVYAKKFDAFIYVSASHNPVGHNGIKFGLNNGSVLSKEEMAGLIKIFQEKCKNPESKKNALTLVSSQNSSSTSWIYAEAAGCKREALSSYKAFIKSVISATNDLNEQEEVFSQIQKSAKTRKLGIVCDMNGSVRSLSIDKELFAELGIPFYIINDSTRTIPHGIIPEGENLLHCAREIERLQQEGYADAVLGYMPDCDGDRGNIVYWDKDKNKACVLDAQTVFALSVLGELCFMNMLYGADKNYKGAVVVNGPTSNVIEEISSLFSVKVFRAEVGETNVVTKSEEERKNGFVVRISGEGSNGGSITHPSSVRDPLATLFSIIKLLCIDGLYLTWCEKIKQKFTEDFTVSDIVNTIPKYTTTQTQELEALLSIKTQDVK
ncbi:MAG: phosphoglucomutase, partial [Treponema sp.]|nr:phosphoglucomutase [Treponema sp.]